jgi:hypothetical protein
MLVSYEIVYYTYYTTLWDKIYKNHYLELCDRIQWGCLT